MPFDSVNYDFNDSVLRNLTAARGLLSDERRWLQGTYCIADSFCALGAVMQAAGHDPREAPDDVTSLPIQGEIRTLREVLPDRRTVVHLFNDSPTTTHADVLALFDRAIDARRAKIASKATTEA